MYSAINLKKCNTSNALMLAGNTDCGWTGPSISKHVSSLKTSSVVHGEIKYDLLSEPSWYVLSIPDKAYLSYTCHSH